MKQGSIIKVNFDPTVGSEQAGYRPAVVVSSDFMLSKTNIIMAAPITNTDKPFPTHLPLDSRTKTSGYILCEHTKAMDLKKRPFIVVEELPEDILRNVLDVITDMLAPS